MAPGPPNLGDNRFALLASNPQPKRKKPTYTPLNFPDLPQVKKENPKFLIIRATDKNKPISKHSCFAVHKALEAISKEIVSITELRDGNLLLLVKNPQIAQKFIAAKKLSGVCEIEVSYHENLNNSKGTIFAPCLNNVDEKEIVENMSAQGVVSVFKFKKTVNQVTHHTGVVLLTFNLFKLPEKVEVSWRSAKVRPYYPNPMRCKSCQLLGHTAKHCKNASTCYACNLPPHPPPCTRTFCANCSGNHPSSSNACPKYKQSKEILKIKTQNKCSMREALKLYKEQTPTLLSSSFTDAARNYKTQNNNETNNNNITTSSTSQSNDPPITILPNTSEPPAQANSSYINSTTQQNNRKHVNNIQSADSLRTSSQTTFQSYSNINNNTTLNNSNQQASISQTTSPFISNEINNSPSETFLQTPFNLDSTLSQILAQAHNIQNLPQTITAVTDAPASNFIQNQLPHNNNNSHDHTMSDDDS